MSERQLLYRRGRKAVWFQDDGDAVHTWNEYDGEADDKVKLARQMTELEDGRRHDGMRLEALIPAHVLEDSFAQGWFHDDKAWRRWANDPDNKHFRVEHGGKVKRL